MKVFDAEPGSCSKARAACWAAAKALVVLMLRSRAKSFREREESGSFASLLVAAAASRLEKKEEECQQKDLLEGGCFFRLIRRAFLTIVDDYTGETQ